MNITRHKRLGRVAACTALALTAGMALAGTAAADGAAPGVPAKPQLHRSEPVAPLPVESLPVQRQGLAARDAAAPRFDVNGDGLEDLLYRQIGNTYYMKTRVGDDQKFELLGGNEQETFKDVIPVGDLNHALGDGTRPELLTLSVTGKLSLYGDISATGAGYASWSGSGWNIYNKLAAPGDLTGDGTPDLLARKYSGELYLYPATGNISTPFRAPVKVGAGWQGYDQLVGAGDLDADGHADVLGRTPSGNLYFYKGTGKAAAPFRAGVKVGYGWGVYNQILPAGDRNGDGDVDVLARDAAGTIWYYGSNGNGTFAPRQKSGTGWEWTGLYAGQGGIPAHGKYQILGRNSAGTLFEYAASANGKLSAREQVSDTGGWAGPVTVHFPSSLGTQGYASFLWRYDGQLWRGDQFVGHGWGVYNSLAGTGDLSGDGIGDLLARDKSGNLYLYRSNGGTGFYGRIKVGAGWSGYNALVGAGDYTGDGRADLLARTGSGSLYLYPGTGNAKAPFKARVKIGTGYGTYNKLASAGDMTGDGRADLIGVDSRGNAYRYAGTGLGGAKTLSSRVLLGSGWNTYVSLH